MLVGPAQHVERRGALEFVAGAFGLACRSRSRSRAGTAVTCSQASSARATYDANDSSVLASFEVAAQHALGVVGRLGGGHAQAAELATELGVLAHQPAEVHLEGVLVAVRALRDDALEADVGDLEACARVRAAVHVDRDRSVEVGQPLSRVPAWIVVGALLRLDERELAELDAGAGDRAAPERRGTHREPERVEFVGERVGARALDVDDDDALLRGEADPAAAEPLGQVRRPGAARHPRCVRTSWSRRPTPARCAARGRRCGRGARATRAAASPSGNCAVQVLVLQHLAELLRTPVGHQELQPRVVARCVGSRSRGTPTRRRPTPRSPRPDGRRRRAARRSADSSRARRRPTGRSRARRRGRRRRRTRRR